jgi:hypothetical protein
MLLDAGAAAEEGILTTTEGPRQSKLSVMSYGIPKNARDPLVGLTRHCALIFSFLNNMT